MFESLSIYLLGSCVATLLFVRTETCKWWRSILVVAFVFSISWLGVIAALIIHVFEFFEDLEIYEILSTDIEEIYKELKEFKEEMKVSK